MFQFLRKEDRTPVGILVAKQIGNKVGIGYSLCSEQDVFQKEKGRMIARRRAEKNVNSETVFMHTSMINGANELLERAKKYFSDKEIITQDFQSNYKLRK